MMSCVGHISRIEKKRNAYKVLVGNPERKRPLSIPRHRWEDSIKMDLKDIEWEGVNWISLAQAGTNGAFSEHFNDSLGSIKCG
jgi:hypothetical protein